jgi:glycosyltransferase involved in cell wall biosynthesis
LRDLELEIASPRIAMKVNVILCTYNRCGQLPQALESVAVSIFHESMDWEVLVVDNNSSDGTKGVVEEFSVRYPGRFRYVFEPQQGKSFALNRGILESNGDVLAFMDDDVTVEPDWLHKLTEPLSDSQWAGTGGRIYLPRDFSPPSWLKLEGPYSLGGVLALFDHGSEAAPLSIPPIGTNMAFRREIFKRYGGFRTDLGPRPGSEIRYEDTELGARLLKGGERILYVPSAIVRHAVAERRLKKEYYLEYSFNYGRAVIRERGNRPAIAFIPRPIVGLSNRLLIILPSKIWNWLKESDPQQRFFEKCLVWTVFGEIVEIVHRLFSSGSKQSNFHPQTTKQ